MIEQPQPRPYVIQNQPAIEMQPTAQPVVETVVMAQPEPTPLQPTETPDPR